MNYFFSSFFCNRDIAGHEVGGKEGEGGGKAEVRRWKFHPAVTSGPNHTHTHTHTALLLNKPCFGVFEIAILQVMKWEGGREGGEKAAVRRCSTPPLLISTTIYISSLVRHRRGGEENRGVELVHKPLVKHLHEGSTPRVSQGAGSKEASLHFFSRYLGSFALCSLRTTIRGPTKGTTFGEAANQKCLTTFLLTECNP